MDNGTSTVYGFSRYRIFTNAIKPFSVLKKLSELIKNVNLRRNWFTFPLQFF